MFSFFRKKSSKKEDKTKKFPPPIPVADFMIGFHEEKGRRASMEDKVCTVDLDPDGTLGLKTHAPRVCFFAVFDGHGGSETSGHLEHALHTQLSKDLATVMDKYTTDEAGDQLVIEAVRGSFSTVDAEICKQSYSSGSTASTALVIGNRLFCSNVGDSRVVLCRGGKAIGLTEDHKPSRPDEKARIAKSGGFVMNGRVLGELAVSRAFGDKKFKDLEEIAEMLKVDDDEAAPKVVEPLVSSIPDVQTETLCAEDEFLLIACDGLFDVMTNQQAIDFVREQLVEHNDPSRAANATTKQAVYVKGSTDNVSVVIVRLRETLPPVPPNTNAAAEPTTDTPPTPPTETDTSSD